MNGIIILDKPQGRTSHNMVSFMRKLTKIKRIGHTGTLDPMATGVLPICIGSATKAADMLTMSDKRYTAVMKLGITTDTEDISGTVLSEADVNVSCEEITAAVNSFKGEIEQLPPMYSAIKKDGKKLYELARCGIEIEREKRKITIYSVEILNIDTKNHEITIDVKCSKGTYIRTLCADIGKKLGTGACMTALRRTETGPFNLAEAVSEEMLSSAEDVKKHLIPIDEIFADYPKLFLNEKQKRSIVNGVRMTWRTAEEGQCYRLYDEDGRFLCISKCTDGRLKLEKAFWN